MGWTRVGRAQARAGAGTERTRVGRARARAGAGTERTWAGRARALARAGLGTRWTRLGRALALAGVTAVAGVGGAAAQTSGPEPALAWFEDAYRRMGVRATDGELARLADLWGRVTDPDAPVEARQGSLRALLDAMSEIQGVPAWRYTEPALQAMALRAQELEGMEAPPPLLPVESGRWGEPGRVEVVGDGPVPLVLVSDLDYGGSVYRTFAEAHGDRFTSYIVTLPGAEGTPPPPLEGPVSATPWLDNAEEIVLALVRERGLEDPVVVGVMGGVYTAARLALEHPERFRAAVLLHGLVGAPTMSPTDPSRLATEAERAAFADATLPPLFPTDTVAAAQQYRAFAGAAAIDSATAQKLTDRAARTHPAVFLRYASELGVTDLHADFAELRVPTLAIPSVHDPRSPVGNTEMGTGQWQSVALDHPDIPLVVVPFPATRNYAPVDRPGELARTLEAFLDGDDPRRPTAAPAPAAYRASPSAEVMHWLGATEVRISWGSPGVKGRTVWGGLVPWGQLWRAGANAATRMDFSEDVLVEGRPLEAGSYSFFVIPRERGPWTLVFNRVAVQAGSFFHEPRHDALRVEVEPRPASHREWLTYRIEPRPPVEGRIELLWADRAVGFEVEAREDTGLDRIPVSDPGRLESLDWTHLGVDPVDGAQGQAPDGRAVSWTLEGDTAWFRIALHEPADPAGVGVNLVFDTDVDQGTGSPFWAGTSGFTYDRVGTVWVMRSEGSWWGTVGLSDHVGAAAGDYRSLDRESLRFAMSADGTVLYVGAPAREVRGRDGRTRVMVAVGTSSIWNDNLLDAAPPVLELDP